VDKIVASNIADSKPSFTVSTEAAATLTIGAGELGIFMGINVKAINNQRVVSAFIDLRDRLREAEYPVGPLAVNFVSGTPPSAEGYAVGNALAIPVLTEDDAVIAYGAAFYPAGNSGNYSNKIDRLIERFQEDLLPFG